MRQLLKLDPGADCADVGLIKELRVRQSNYGASNIRVTGFATGRVEGEVGAIDIDPDIPRSCLIAPRVRLASAEPSGARTQKASQCWVHCGLRGRRTVDPLAACGSGAPARPSRSRTQDFAFAGGKGESENVELRSVPRASSGRVGSAGQPSQLRSVSGAVQACAGGYETASNVERDAVGGPGEGGVITARLSGAP
jgi:hypothetical protein